MYLFEWFYELDDRRTFGFEKNPITWSDMQAWSELTGNRPQLWEWVALTKLDSVVLGRWEDPGVKPVTLFDQISRLKGQKDG